MGAHRGRAAGVWVPAIIVACLLGVAPGAAAQAPASHAVANGFALPADLAWGPDGRLYTTDHLAAAVSVVNVGTAAAPGTGTPVFTGGLRSPGAIAFDQGGNLWVADDAAQGGGVLMRVPFAAGRLQPGQAAIVARFTEANGASLRPTALALDNLGNLYVGMARDGEIARVTTVGTITVQRDFAHTSTDSGALGLAFDGHTTLLVSEDTNITAVDLTPGPSPKPTFPFLTTPLGAIGLAAPTDIVVTPDSIFIVDTLRVVQVPIAGGQANPAAASVRMNLSGTGGGLVADQIGRPRGPLGDLPNPALLAGDDPGNGDTATGTIVVSNAPLTAPGLLVPPLLPVAPAPAPAPAASARRRVLAIQILPRGTRAPTFPRLRRSGVLFHPGAGRVFSVTFRVARSARLTFTIRTRRGAFVRRIRAGGRARGTVVRFNWDGRDRRGRLVRAGLYRFTITATARGYHRTARGSVRVIRAR